MEIWRVENDEGEGCYIGHPETKPILQTHLNTLTHPHPLADFEIARLPKTEEISGFCSEVQAKRWFSEDNLKQLKPLGFRLRKVSVKEITIQSRFQVLAIRDSKKNLVERLFDSYMDD